MFARIFKLGAQGTAKKIIYTMCEKLDVPVSLFYPIDNYDVIIDIFSAIIKKQISYSAYQRLPQENKLHIKNMLADTLVQEIHGYKHEFKAPWADVFSVSFPDIFLSEVKLTGLLSPTFIKVRAYMAKLNPNIKIEENTIFDDLMLLGAKTILTTLVTNNKEIVEFDKLAMNLKFVLVTDKHIWQLLKNPKIFANIIDDISSALIQLCNEYDNIEVTTYRNRSGEIVHQTQTEGKGITQDISNKRSKIEIDRFYPQDFEDLYEYDSGKAYNRLPAKLFDNLAELRRQLSPLFSHLKKLYKVDVYNYKQVLPQFLQQQPIPTDTINIITEYMGINSQKRS